MFELKIYTASRSATAHSVRLDTPRDRESHPAIIADALLTLIRDGVPTGGLDFSEAQLTKEDLSGRRFAGCALRSAHFDNCALNQTDFSGAQLENSIFSGSSLRNARFCGANLYRTRFISSDLWNADFSGADLTGVKFESTETGSARLRGANLPDEAIRPDDLPDPRSRWISYEDTATSSSAGRDKLAFSVTGLDHPVKIFEDHLVVNGSIIYPEEIEDSRTDLPSFKMTSFLKPYLKVISFLMDYRKTTQSEKTRWVNPGAKD